MKKINPSVFIYKKILSIYPFLSHREKRSFVLQAKPYLKKYSSQLSLKEKLVSLRSLLLVLKNDHADLREAPTKTGKKKGVKGLLTPEIFFDKKDKILLLRIPSWRADLAGIEKKLIRACVQNKKQTRGILLDVRENGGGDSRIAHAFASIFFEKPISYGYFLKKEKGKLQKTEAVLKSNGKIFINTPIVILISKKCFSSNELFLAPFVVRKRALLIGETTRGGSGNPISLPITVGTAKMVARIPQWRFFLKGKKQPIEKTKIKPTIQYAKADILDFAKKQLLN